MFYRTGARRRHAAVAVEAALILPTTFFLVLGLIVVGLGVFRYNEVAHATREVARFASVHGAQYATNNAAAITAGTLPTVNKTYLTSLVKSNLYGLDPSKVTVSVTMTVMQLNATASSATQTVDWDSTTQNQSRSPYSAWTDTTTTPNTNHYVQNVVSVTVSYQWFPELYLVGPITLTSTAVMPMQY